jgi:hypothetical protein
VKYDVELRIFISNAARFTVLLIADYFVICFQCFMDELAADKGKQPMEDVDEKFDFNTDEDDHVASVKSDSDYEGIFAAFIHVFEVL